MVVETASNLCFVAGGRLHIHKEAPPLQTPAECAIKSRAIQLRRCPQSGAASRAGTGLPPRDGHGLFPRMSTLQEIEAAVESLPRPEQEVLLNFLENRLRKARPSQSDAANRVRLPLVRSRHPGTVDVSNAQIEAFLSE